MHTLIDKLKEGNRRFVSGLPESFKTQLSARKETAKQQKPQVIILSCADSRVIPETIFDASIGELFVVRVAGNVANKSTIASIEFAVTQLKSRLIVVLGHQNCGAVSAAIDNQDLGPHLNHLISGIKRGLNIREEKPDLHEAFKINTKYSALSLKKESAIISEKCKNDSLRIVTAYYELDSGIVFFEEG